MADKRIRYEAGLDDSGFAAGIRRMNSQLNDASGRVGGLFSGLTGHFTALSGMITAVSSLLAGGAFAVGIKNAIEFQDQMGKGAQKAGVTTAAFSELAFAAKLADVETEQFTKSMAKLSNVLSEGQQGQKEAVDLFAQLKLDPNKIRNSEELLSALADRFSHMEDGARKTALAIDVFGERLGPHLVPFLNAGAEGIAKLRQEARELGASVSEDAAKKAEVLNDELKKLGEVSHLAARTIAQDLALALSRGIQYFIAAAKEAGVFQAVLISIGALMAKGLGIDEAGKLEASLKANRIEAQKFRDSVAEMQRVMSLDPLVAKMLSYPQLIEQNRAKVAALEADILRTGAELARLNAGPGTTGPGRSYVSGPTVSPAFNDPFTPGAKTPTTDKPKEIAAPSSYMAYYEGMLAEEQHANAVLTQGREYTKAQEAEFWRFLLANLEVTTADRVAILRKLAQAEVATATKSRKEREAIEREDIDAARALGLNKIAIEQDAARQNAELGLVTNEQLLLMEQGFEDQRYQIQKAALDARLALLAQDPEMNPVEMRRIKNDLLLLEAEYQRTKQAAAAAIQLAANQPAANVWKVAEDQLASAIDGMINRTQTLRGALTSIWAGIRSAIVAEMAKMLAARAIAWLREKAMAVTSIGANAAVAGSGAAASQASIPFAGPYLALAAMAAITAAVLGQKGSIPSAAQGWSLPSGANPLTQLHENEMVLDAKHARVIDDLANGGGGGAPINLHVYATDAQSVARLFRDNGQHIVDALKQQRRNFSF